MSSRWIKYDCWAGVERSGYPGRWVQLPKARGLWERYDICDDPPLWWYILLTPLSFTGLSVFCAIVLVDRMISVWNGSGKYKEWV